MSADMSLSDVLHGNWLLHADDSVANEESERKIASVKHDEHFANGDNAEDGGDKEVITDLEEAPNAQRATLSASNEKKVLISPPFHSSTGHAPKTPMEPAETYYTNYVNTHGYPVSSTYHQPFLSMVRNKKQSALSTALQRRSQTFPTQQPNYMFYSSYSGGYEQSQQSAVTGNDVNNNEVRDERPKSTHVDVYIDSETGAPRFSASYEKKSATSTSLSSLPTSSVFGSSGCTRTTSTPFLHQNRCFELPANVLDGLADDGDEHHEDGRQSIGDERVPNSGDAGGDERRGAEMVVDDDGEDDDELVVVGEKKHGEEVVLESEDGVVENTEETSSDEGKTPTSALAALLMRPVKKPTYFADYQPFVVAFSAPGNQSSSSDSQQLPQQQQSSKTMQFYQPPAQQHLVRTTPPPGFAQPYGMGMRPHEEETRQIMNLDNQQTHNSSPTSSWNQPYPQMTNLNAYQPRGPALYPPPPSMVHQNGPSGPTPNPYYPQTAQTHHHMQPQAPMMATGMHGQQQQPYYNTQSPLTGTPPSMNYGTPQMPAPQNSNGSAPIFNFSKPRNSNEGSVSGGGHRRKKQNDLSSPRYNNNNSNDDVDGAVFPDMTDFPLLDVVQSKAKKDAGRKPCRPHLCEQSRMLISRVCHFHREFIKRLPPRHPLANSPFSKPDQWTSQIMGISLATVRKCVDMAVDEEVFTRCTDKNLVNLTPSERAEREELLSKLSTVFEDEKSLGAGTAGLTIAEYSPRRSYSNTTLRAPADEKSANTSFMMNGAEYASSETTLLNLDDHSNSSKDFGTTPTPTMEMSNGGSTCGPVFEEIGVVKEECPETLGEKEALSPKEETPKRGRPRKGPTGKANRRKDSVDDSETVDDVDHEKKTEDEDETNEETENKTDELQQMTPVEREDDAASSEGTNRSETATPEPTAIAAATKKTRATRRKKRNTADVDEEYISTTKKKRGAVAAATTGTPHLLDDENAEHKMLTRARSRQP